MKRFLAIILFWTLSLSFAKAYSPEANLQTFSTNLHKQKAVLRDTLNQTGQKFKRWELGVNGGVNFQLFKSQIILLTYGYRLTSYPLTGHVNILIQYYFSKKIGVKLSSGYNRFGYKVLNNDPDWPAAYSRSKFERTFNVYNLESDFVYRVKLSRKLFLNTYLGFKTSMIQKQIDYYADWDGALWQERFYPRKPDYRFNLHACAGLQASYELGNRIKLNTSLCYYYQILDFKDFLEIPLAGYKEWQTILRIKHIACSLGMSYQF